MPIYEYKCDDCGSELEILHSVGSTKRKCVECGGKIRKMVSQIRYHDTYSPMHPRRGRGVGGYGRIDPGEGFSDIGKNF